MIRKYRSTTIRTLGGLALSLHPLVFGGTYTITDLNAPSDVYRWAHGIDSAGNVVGEYETSNSLTIGAFWFSYAGQFTTPLSAGNTWQTFTNLAGTGLGVRVTDSSATDSERYYRVVAQ